MILNCTSLSWVPFLFPQTANSPESWYLVPILYFIIYLSLQKYFDKTILHAMSLPGYSLDINFISFYVLVLIDDTAMCCKNVDKLWKRILKRKSFGRLGE